MAKMTRLRQGLSPRVRGNPWTLILGRWKKRSIPAGAGEPTRIPTLKSLGKVYPRGCGGTADFRAEEEADRGLSPRVRGNLFPSIMASRYARSIPAGAGEPLHQQIYCPCFRVYPRGCGGTGARGNCTSQDPGLSPRVRGNHTETRIQKFLIRSIPAGAGEPA